MTDDELSAIVSLLGRDPTDLELAMLLGDVVGALLLQVIP